jgi:hypothetical protein
MSKYLVKSVEHVYDAFDDYEHANTLEPLVVEADSVEDAAIAGYKLLQGQVDKERREGGFLSSGTFIVELKSVSEITDETKNTEFNHAYIAPFVENKQKVLKIFLCHASEDKKNARLLFDRLKAQGIYEPWIDEENILPGEEWDYEIKKAVRNSDVIIALLSNKSVTKEGYVQKEITFALDVADEKPEGTTFIIPIKLEECSIPQRLQRWQYTRFGNDEDFSRLLRALKKRFEQIKHK